MERQAIIYIITCQDTGKCYVGQTTNLKKTRGKWYKYGISQRLVEHFGAARRKRTTPLAKAIRQYGIESFSVEELERCDMELSDDRESYHIRKCQTLFPDGYNVQKQARIGNGLMLPEHMVSLAEIRGIKKGDTVARVRVLLTIENEKNKRRFMFGSSGKDFEKSLQEAKEFCEQVKAERIILHSSLTESDCLWWPYKEKLDSLDRFKVKRLRATRFRGTMVRIHIRTGEMTSYRQEKLITFGGKTISKDSAYTIALAVVEEMKNRHPEAIVKIEDNLK